MPATRLVPEQLHTAADPSRLGITSSDELDIAKAASHGVTKPAIATGTITASGTLAQAIPPSLVLIVLADQLGRSVGDMYAGALIPGLLLVGLYLLFVALVAIFRPTWVPALPVEARIYRESNGASGYASLIVLLALCTAAGWAWAQMHNELMKSWTGRNTAAHGDSVHSR